MFNGLTRGLALIADFLKLFVQSIRSGNIEAITTGCSIANTWISETVNEAGAVKVSGWSLVFGGSDPWKESRAMYRLYETRFKGNL